jgi:hypothetical protein
LHKQHALFRVYAGGYETNRHVNSALFKCSNVILLRNGVMIDDTDEALVLMLEFNPVLYGAQVIADMEVTGGLNPGKYA